MGNRRREARGRRRCKADLDLALRLARRPASFSVGRRAAFSQRQQAVQPVLRQRIRPRLRPSPFSSCGRPSAAAAACSASARKSACEAKRNLGCRGLGGALAHPLPPERSGVPRGPLGSSEGLACPEPRRGRQRASPRGTPYRPTTSWYIMILLFETAIGGAKRPARGSVVSGAAAEEAPL